MSVCEREDRICVCVCVCEREEKGREDGRVWLI